MTEDSALLESRVLVVGAGGLGGYLGSVIHRRDVKVHLVARGPHLAAIRAAGLTVVDGETVERYAIPASATVPPVRPGDVVFVTVKSYALGTVVADLARLGNAGAWIVPLLNGVDTGTALTAAGVPPDRILLGVAYLTAFRTGPGEIERRGRHGRLFVGSRVSAAGAGARFVDAVWAALEAEGIDVVETDDIERESWRKMLVVSALTGACARLRRPIGAVLATTSGRRFVADLVAEASRVGRGLGVRLTDEEDAHALRVLEAFPFDFRPSLIHDLTQGVPTEVEALNGALCRFGETVGVPTPVHWEAAEAIRAAQREPPGTFRLA